MCRFVMLYVAIGVAFCFLVLLPGYICEMRKKETLYYMQQMQMPFFGLLFYLFFSLSFCAVCVVSGNEAGTIKKGTGFGSCTLCYCVSC